MMAIASVLSNIPHLKAFETMAEQQFAAIDLSVVAMYFVQTAPAAALPALAKQLNVEGWKGWLFAETEQEKRDLLAKAITLQRKKGTIFAIREALKAVGYLGASIIKVAAVTYDGSESYDGAIDHEGGFWASFIVRVQIPFGYTPTAADTETVTRIVGEYKSERDELVAIEWEELPV